MSLRIDLTDRHDQHPASVKDYARQKVEKLSRIFDQLQHIEIIFDTEKGEHTVEVIVSANHHMHFVGHATSDSVLASIDRVMDKLERQVHKAKERMRDHHRGDGGRTP